MALETATRLLPESPLPKGNSGILAEIRRMPP
jgi:hypothetical protein